MRLMECYLKAVGMFRNYSDESQDPVFSEVLTLDLATVVSSVSGPKRPHDRVPVADMPADFQQCLTNKVRIIQKCGIPIVVTECAIIRT